MEACGGDAMSYWTGREVSDPPYAEVGGDAADENCGYDIGGEPLVMDWADITGDVIYEKKKEKSASRQWHATSLITVSFKLLVKEIELELGRSTGGRRIIGRSLFGG